MLLAIDIGNSSIKFGFFDGKRLVSKFSIPTNRDYTSEQVSNAGDWKEFQPITSAIACSVVPKVDQAVRQFVKSSFGIETFFVDNNFDFGLKINYEPVTAAGTDRLVNAFAAVAKHGKPCVVCSLGTATTIDAVNAKGEFLGGIIAPGMRTMAAALHLGTAKLPEVDIEKPSTVIGRTTGDSIRSGIFYGQLAMIEGMVERISNELEEKPAVVATGGFSELMAAESNVLEFVDENLLLGGLNLISRRLYTCPEK